MKIRIIIYWVTTVLIALETLAGGVTDLAHGRTSVVSGPFVVDVITPWLSGIPSHDPRSVEAGGRCDLACSGVSAAQGMGVCWNFLRTNRCRCIVRGARRDYRRSDCATRSNWPGGRFVGASTAKPYARCSLPCQ